MYCKINKFYTIFFSLNQRQESLIGFFSFLFLLPIFLFICPNFYENLFNSIYKLSGT